MMNWNDWFGDAGAPGWIVVYVVVGVLILGALLAFGTKKKRERDHEQAESLRADALRDKPKLDQQEAQARRLEAQSAEARAEADRIDAIARRKRENVAREQSDHAERLREADRLDPATDDSADTSTDRARNADR